VEDLWTFNEESVARAIAACRIPVISAVGHETDFTISDFVADLRAPTPSAAAEMVVGSQGQLVERLESIEGRVRQSVLYRISIARRRLQELSVDRAAATLHRAIGRSLQRVDALDARMRESARASSASGRERIERLEQRLARFDLRLRLAEGRRRLEAAASRLDQSIQWRLAAQRRKLEPLDAQLAQLSPLRVLDRGYAIVQTPQGTVVKNASEVTAGSLLDVRLARGALRVEVESSSG
jgi:exodeoxyribonuclease VII large subunit